MALEFCSERLTTPVQLHAESLRVAAPTVSASCAILLQYKKELPDARTLVYPVTYVPLCTVRVLLPCGARHSLTGVL